MRCDAFCVQVRFDILNNNENLLPRMQLLSDSISDIYYNPTDVISGLGIKRRQHVSIVSTGKVFIKVRLPGIGCCMMRIENCIISRTSIKHFSHLGGKTASFIRMNEWILDLNVYPSLPRNNSRHPSSTNPPPSITMFQIIIPIEKQRY